MLATQDISPGFQSPALDAQKAFREIMEGWARPGRLVDVSGIVPAPAGLAEAAAVVALTLVDADTPVWLSDQSAGAAPWLRFHCGCAIVDAAMRSEFAFMSVDEPTDLASFETGTAMEPERGATLVVRVPSLGQGDAYQLTGPGIDGVHTVRVEGLPDALLDQRAAQRKLFPAGLDLVFVSGAQLVCLPRTTLMKREV